MSPLRQGEGHFGFACPAPPGTLGGEPALLPAPRCTPGFNGPGCLCHVSDAGRESLLRCIHCSGMCDLEVNPLLGGFRPCLPSLFLPLAGLFRGLLTEGLEVGVHF